jgi:hypothetical protein
MTRAKLFWPLAIVAVVAVILAVFLAIGGEDDDEVAARFIPGYTPGAAQPPANGPATAPPQPAPGQPQAVAQDASSPLHAYFAGSMVQFGYGSGTSSNNPRVELVIHYCPSGLFFSAGNSCRPNIIAKGYQCTPVQDAGRWQVSGTPNQGMLQWVSNNGAPGTVAVQMRSDGVVVDPRGNPFNRVGRAQCQ